LASPRAQRARDFIVPELEWPRHWKASQPGERDDVTKEMLR
jgi:hypothetical protein